MREVVGGRESERLAGARQVVVVDLMKKRRGERIEA